MGESCVGYLRTPDMSWRFVLLIQYNDVERTKFVYGVQDQVVQYTIKLIDIRLVLPFLHFWYEKYPGSTNVQLFDTRRDATQSDRQCIVCVDI